MFHILLPLFDRRLPKLCRNLRRGIIHELAICAEDIARRATLLLVRVGAASARCVRLLLGLRRAGWRRRRSELGNGRDVLRHRMVQRRRLGVRCPLHYVRREDDGGGLMVMVVKVGEG